MNEELRNPYTIKTPEICKILGVTRMTLYTWEQQGIFTPPRNKQGDRVFTKEQAKEILRAFGPSGSKGWHFEPDG